MNYETAEERATLTIPAPKFALGQVVKVKGGYCGGAVQSRVYCPDDSFWLYCVLRGDTMQLAGYLAEYTLESAEK